MNHRKYYLLMEDTIGLEKIQGYVYGYSETSFKATKGSLFCKREESLSHSEHSCFTSVESNEKSLKCPIEKMRELTFPAFLILQSIPTNNRIKELKDLELKKDEELSSTLHLVNVSEKMEVQSVVQPNADEEDDRDIIKNFENHYSCPICLDIVENAMECQNCHKAYCERCIIGVEVCPNCRIVPFDTQPNINLRQFIGNLKTKCTNVNEGCPERPTRSNLRLHLKKCQWSLVSCSNSGCNVMIRKVGLNDHLLECPHQMIPCPFEGCGKMGARVTLDQHRNQCSFAEINCINCDVRILKKNENGHSNTCQFAMVRCPLCDSIDTRANVLHHLIDAHYNDTGSSLCEWMQSLPLRFSSG